MATYIESSTLTLARRLRVQHNALNNTLHASSYFLVTEGGAWAYHYGSANLLGSMRCCNGSTSPNEALTEALEPTLVGQVAAMQAKVLSGSCICLPDLAVLLREVEAELRKGI